MADLYPAAKLSDLARYNDVAMKLGPRNWVAWDQQMQCVLLRFGLSSLLEDLAPPVSAFNTFKGFVGTHVEDHLRALVLRAASPVQMWRELKALCCPNANVTSMTLLRDIATVVQGDDEPVTQYIYRVQQIYFRMQEGNVQYTESNAVHNMLNGVRAEFLECCANFMERAGDNNLTFEAAGTRLLNHERNLRDIAGRSKPAPAIPAGFVADTHVHMTEASPIADVEVQAFHSAASAGRQGQRASANPDWVQRLEAALREGGFTLGVAPRTGPSGERPGRYYAPGERNNQRGGLGGPGVSKGPGVSRPREATPDSICNRCQGKGHFARDCRAREPVPKPRQAVPQAHLASEEPAFGFGAFELPVSDDAQDLYDGIPKAY